MEAKLKSADKLAIQRLTALWALSESGLGGLLHAINSPFTGLIVGSISVILISLILSFAKDKWRTILMALTIVLIIKAAVAPHSNLTAYIAVSFQALAGVLVFSVIRHPVAAGLIFAVIALLESAAQKLLVLYILYGESFFRAIDAFGEWVGTRMGDVLPFISARNLVIFYMGIYGLAGILTGLFVARLIRHVRIHRFDPRYNIEIARTSQERTHKNRTRNNRRMVPLYLFLLTAALLGLYTYFTEGWLRGFYIMARALFLLATWYLFIAPFIYKKIKKFLDQRQSQMAEEIDHIFDILPYLKTIISLAWRNTRHTGIFQKWYRFSQEVILYSLQFKVRK